MTSRAVHWTAALIVVSVALIVGSHWGVLDPAEELAHSALSPLQRGLRNVSDPVADWLSNVTEVGELSDENKALREENEKLKEELARLRESEIRFKQLEELLRIEQAHPEEEYLAANVLAKDPSNLKELVAIDRGKRDGVQKGMIVVSEGHSLVGTVTAVLENHAWVTLITDPNSAVSAMVQESRAQGVVTGSYDHTLSIEFVSQGAAVNEGDIVLTSAIGGHYPAGLVIGEVTAVDSTPQELFKKVAVQPLARLGHLETVLVLTSFLPLELVGP